MAVIFSNLGNALPLFCQINCGWWKFNISIACVVGFYMMWWSHTVFIFHFYCRLFIQTSKFIHNFSNKLGFKGISCWKRSNNVDSKPEPKANFIIIRTSVQSLFILGLTAFSKSRRTRIFNNMLKLQESRLWDNSGKNMYLHSGKVLLQSVTISFIYSNSTRHQK